MNKTKQKAALHVMIDVEAMKRLYAEPIAPMTIPGTGTLSGKGWWKKMVKDIVLKHQRGFLAILDRYRDLLTEAERHDVEDFRQSVAKFEKNWRNGPIPYPKIPRGFDTLLHD
jgi:hypothetical protein